VLELTPLILQKLYSAIEPGPHDYCVIVDAEQRVHYLNKRTGTTSTEPPPGFTPPDSSQTPSTDATSTAKNPADLVASASPPTGSADGAGELQQRRVESSCGDGAEDSSVTE
jgi:hypothetical protein